MADIFPFNEKINVIELLDIYDYITAESYEDFFYGFIQVIHMNIRYPEYKNILIDFDTPDIATIYTENGWKKRKYTDVIKKLVKEAQEGLDGYEKNMSQINALKLALQKMTELDKTKDYFIIPPPRKSIPKVPPRKIFRELALSENLTRVPNNKTPKKKRNNTSRRKRIDPI